MGKTRLDLEVGIVREYLETKAETVRDIVGNHLFRTDLKVDGKNKYFGVNGYTVMILDTGRWVLVDQEDVERLKDFRWSEVNGYIESRTTGRQIYIHRFLQGLDNDNDLVVDHVNHIKYDNRQSNLRTVTSQENIRNYDEGKSKSNTGFRGVSYLGQDKGYVVYLEADGKIYRSRHEYLVEAVIQRWEMEMEHWGEVAERFRNSLETLKKMKIDIINRVDLMDMEEVV